MANNLNDYLALVKKRKAAKQTVNLSMPSGMDWVLLPIDVQQLITSGRLPTALYMKIAKDAKAATPEELMETTVKTLELARDVMLSNLVFPKITPLPSKDSIGIEETAEKIDTEDFSFFVQWLVAGGQAGQDTKSPADSRE